MLRFNTTDYPEARELAERAVARDPDYASAWAVIGLTHWWDGRLDFTSQSPEKLDRAREYAERAMAIDDTVSWAIALSVHVAVSQGREREALSIARRGIELNPGSADLRGVLAISLTHVGKYVESISHCRAAISFNPFSLNWYRDGLVRNLVILGQFDDALELLDEMTRTELTHLGAWVCKSYVFFQTGHGKEADKVDRGSQETLAQPASGACTGTSDHQGSSGGRTDCRRSAQGGLSRIAPTTVGRVQARGIVIATSRPACPSGKCSTDEPEI